jgi:hypothetical protein
MIFIYIRTKQKLYIDFSLFQGRLKILKPIANAQKVLYNFIDFQQKYSSGDPVPLKTNGAVQVIH